MNSYDLAEKINNAILQRSSSTTTILRDARMLGKLLKNHDFDWVENELKGYVLDGGIILPSYRITFATQSKTWDGQISPSLHNVWKDWLNMQVAIKCPIILSVPVLEDNIGSGYTYRSGTVLQELGLLGQIKKPIYELITFTPLVIKSILDQIQDRVQEQVSSILSTPIINSVSFKFGILFRYMELLPETKNDFEIITTFLESGSNHVIAARTSRSIIHELIRYLIPKKIPEGYIFTDGKDASIKGEKSKIKYYLEQKGNELYHNSSQLLFIDTLFREFYDMSSKADKSLINIYEANLCIDKFIDLLEKLNRYTNLKSIT